jgi:hypothetical protein
LSGHFSVSIVVDGALAMVVAATVVAAAEADVFQTYPLPLATQSNSPFAPAIGVPTWLLVQASPATGAFFGFVVVLAGFFVLEAAVTEGANANAATVARARQMRRRDREDGRS